MVHGRRKQWLIAALVGIFVIPVVAVPVIYLVRPATLLMAILAARSKLNERVGPDQHECTGRWSIPVAGKDSRWKPAFPETNAAYFLLPVATRSGGRSLRFDIAGDFPKASSMSLDLHDSSSGRVLSSLRASEIKAYEGSENPFLDKIHRDTPNRRYVVRVAPVAHYADYLPNILAYPEDVEHVALVLRVYRSDDADAGSALDSTGGVGLPRVHAYNTDTGERAPDCDSVWRLSRLDFDEAQRQR